jgi:hypothetical protein
MTGDLHSYRAIWGLYGWQYNLTVFWIMQDGRDYSCKHKWRKVSFWDEADFSGEAWDNFMIDDNICPDRATVPEMKIMISSLYHNQDVVKKLEPGWRVEEEKIYNEDMNYHDD